MRTYLFNGTYSFWMHPLPLFVTYNIIYYPIRNKTDDIYLNALADDVLSVMGKKLEG